MMERLSVEDRFSNIEYNLKAFISTVIGRTFSFTDIICYGIGCTAFYLAEKIINKKKVII